MAVKKISNKLKLKPWQQSCWNDLCKNVIFETDGGYDNLKEDGEFPADSTWHIWVMLKNGKELEGRLDRLWKDSGGVCLSSLSRKKLRPHLIDFDISEVIAYDVWMMK